MSELSKMEIQSLPTPLGKRRQFIYVCMYANYPE